MKQGQDTLAEEEEKEEEEGGGEGGEMGEGDEMCLFEEGGDRGRSCVFVILSWLWRSAYDHTERGFGERD